MLGLLIPITFVILEIVMFLIFKKKKMKIETFIKEFVSSTSSQDNMLKKESEVIAILKFSDERKRAIWIFGVILIAIFFILSLIAGLFIFDDNRPDIGIAIAFGITIFAIPEALIIPWILLVEPYGNIRIITKDGILKRSPYTGTCFIRWDQIKSIRWIPIIDNFFIFSEVGFFAINPVYENLDKFAEGVINNVPRAKWNKAEKKVYYALAGPFEP